MWIITVAAVLAFLYGYARQDFQVRRRLGWHQSSRCTLAAAAGLCCGLRAVAVQHCCPATALACCAAAGRWLHMTPSPTPLPTLPTPLQPPPPVQAMMALFTGGCTVAFVATVPDWPAFNKHPIAWLPPKEQLAKRGGGGNGGGERGAGARGAKKKSSSWASLFGF